MAILLGLLSHFSHGLRLVIYIVASEATVSLLRKGLFLLGGHLLLVKIGALCGLENFRGGSESLGCLSTGELKFILPVKLGSGSLLLVHLGLGSEQAVETIVRLQLLFIDGLVP